MFFLVMIFVLEEWAKTAEVSDLDEDLDDPERMREFKLEKVILAMLESLFSLENVEPESLISKIPFLYKISSKIQNLSLIHI